MTGDTGVELPPRSGSSNLLPTPLSMAGFGMLLCGVAPRGWSAGEGFVLGLLFGLVLVVLAASRPVQTMPRSRDRIRDGREGIVGTAS